MGSSWKKGWWNENPEATGSDPLTITGKMADAKSTMKRGWVLQSHLPNMCEHTHTHTHLGVTWDGSWVVCSGRGLIRPAKVIVCLGKEPQKWGLLCQKGTLAEQRLSCIHARTHQDPSHSIKGIPKILPVHSGMKVSWLWVKGTTWPLEDFWKCWLYVMPTYRPCRANTIQGFPFTGTS